MNKLYKILRPIGVLLIGLMLAIGVVKSRPEIDRQQTAALPPLVRVIETQPVVEPVAPSKRAASRKRPSVVAKARSACARNDKDSARAAYKSLERGDPRRRTIRKSCRKSGVWFL